LIAIYLIRMKIRFSPIQISINRRTSYCR
jgi:hypothetical protein